MDQQSLEQFLFLRFIMQRELRKTTKTNWLKDNRELLRNNNTQPADIRLTTKWLERSKCEDLGKLSE